jgi:hypothetical protein
MARVHITATMTYWFSSDLPAERSYSPPKLAVYTHSFQISIHKHIHNYVRSGIKYFGVMLLYSSRHTISYSRSPQNQWPPCSWNPSLRNQRIHHLDSGLVTCYYYAYWNFCTLPLNQQSNVVIALTLEGQKTTSKSLSTHHIRLLPQPLTHTHNLPYVVLHFQQCR